VDLTHADRKISPMVIALVLVAAWVVLNVALLAAVAIANHRGRVRAAAPAVKVAAPARRSAPVFAAAR
jgi:hypothetical protein